MKSKYTNRYIKQVEPKFFTKKSDFIYTFDKFGKPTLKKWQPNCIQKVDDFGEINYNTIDIIYRKSN